MFARTPRLLLRPGFPEDAPALAKAIADETIARNLANVPWPYRMRDAEAYLASPRHPGLPSCLIFEVRAEAPELAGACGLGRRASGAVELGYWLARPLRGPRPPAPAGPAAPPPAGRPRPQRVPSSRLPA